MWRPADALCIAPSLLPMAYEPLPLDYELEGYLDHCYNECSGFHDAEEHTLRAVVSYAEATEEMYAALRAFRDGQDVDAFRLNDTVDTYEKRRAELRNELKQYLKKR